jgi:hypothetical protein
MVHCFICSHSIHTIKTITCQHCQSSYCKSCFQSYLLESNQIPHCANHSCRIEWIEVLTILPRTFKKKYLSLLQHKLFIKESSYLHQLQPVALYYSKLDQMNLCLQEINKKRKENHNNDNQSVKEQRKLDSELLALHKQINKEKLYLHGKTPMPRNDIPLFACPTESCNGFIYKNFYCIVCNSIICHSCGQHKHDTSISCLKKESKPCPNPNCDQFVFKTNHDITCCFSCHELFSWEKGLKDGLNGLHLEQPVVLKNITDIEIPPQKQPTFLIYDLDMERDIYRKINKYRLAARHIRNFVLEHYYANDNLNKERINYLKTPKTYKTYLSFSKKCLLYHMTRYQLQKEFVLVVQFMTVVEDLLSLFTNDMNRNNLLLVQLEETSNQAISQLEKVNHTHPYKGIIKKHNLLIS